MDDEAAALSPEAVFALGAVAQGLAAIIGRSTLEDVDAAARAWVQLVAAAVGAALVTAARPSDRRHNPIDRRGVRLPLLYGAAVGVLTLLTALAVDRLHRPGASMWLFLGPLALALSRGRGIRDWLAAGLAIAGMALLAGREAAGVGGLALLLGASAAWIAAIELGSRTARRGSGSAHLTVALVTAAVVVAPFGAADAGEVFGTPKVLALCALIGVLAATIGRGVDLHVLGRVAPRRFALLVVLLPIATAFLAYVALDDEPSAVEIAGAVIAITAIVTQRPADVTPLRAPA